jgi:lipoprotein-anchoring transpeptidase ErfK/SrfK
MRPFLPVALAAALATFSSGSAQAFFGLFRSEPAAVAQPSPERSLEPSPIARELVPFRGAYAPGTIVVSTAERRLYLVLSGRQAIRYASASADPASNGRASSASPERRNGLIGARRFRC